MLDQLEQMMEISRALGDALDANDVDRAVALLKRRKELTDRMGQLDPGNPDVASGKVAEMLREIVTLDGEIEGKMRAVLGKLQRAIKAVQGEQKMVKGYFKQPDAGEPKFLDKEG
jgi:hypothetical protein